MRPARRDILKGAAAAALAARAQAQERVAWGAQPGPQSALIACPIFEVFFGGARGGGKTDGMLGDWLSHQDQHGGQASGLMVRRTLRDLEDTIKRSREIYPHMGARFHEQDKVWKFPSGAEIKFRYLDKDSDADHYQGHSYSRVYVEELTQFVSPTPVMKLMATLRSGAGIPCGFRATGNPGGPGHQWVKARYIDPAPRGWVVQEDKFSNPWTRTAVTRQRVFIPSRVTDNRYLGDEYIANLQMSGSPQLVRAWLEGDWSVIEGAFFSEWSNEKHVIAPFEIPQSWTRFRSADWGSAHPFSIGWWAIVPDDYRLANSMILPRGAIVRHREWYGAEKPNVGIKMPAEKVADGILAKEIDEQADIEYGILDPAAFASDGGPSIAERMASRGVYFRRADNARVARRGALGGWDQLRARLIGNLDGRPMIYFFSTCRDAIRTIPTLQHDENRPEDVDTESEDHAADDVRYACMSRPYTPEPEAVRRPKLLTVGPDNEVTMDDLWATPSRRPSGRI